MSELRDNPSSSVPSSPPPGPSHTGPLPATPPARPRRSCATQLAAFVGWLLTLALAVALAITAIGAIAFFVFGFTFDSARQLAGAGNQLTAIERQGAAQATSIALLETQAAVQARASSDADENLGQFQQDLGQFEQNLSTVATNLVAVNAQGEALVREATAIAELALELEENIAIVETVQAEGRDALIEVAVVATVQAQNSARLAELERRSEAFLRFLQRLNDLSGDAGDLDALTSPTLTPSDNSATQTTTAVVTPSITRTPTVEATPTATP
jgi:septal ring factor EnvC (AmiA/AmiB activator)